MATKVRVCEKSLTSSRCHMKYFVRVPRGVLAIPFVFDGCIHFYVKSRSVALRMFESDSLVGFSKILRTAEAFLYGVLSLVGNALHFTVLYATSSFACYMDIRSFIASKMSVVDGETFSDYGDLVVHLPRMERVGREVVPESGCGKHTIFLNF